MEASMFMDVNEVVEILGVKKPTAYKIIRQLNDELNGKDFVTIAGRVSRQYLWNVFMAYKKLINRI